MDDLGSQERAVLGVIAANPFVGQQEIADALGLARSTVAAHIAHLTKKGYVLGRGYVLPAPSRIVAIGGAVLDRKFRSHVPFVPATSNPVDGYRSFGGVARNVAENLAKLGLSTSFVSIVGNDETGREMLKDLRQHGVDVSQTIVSDAAPTAEYVALIGPDNDLVVAAADMRIFDHFSPAMLDRIWPHLGEARWVFADCNLDRATLGALIERKRHARFQLAIDAVSTPKVVRLPQDLTGIDALFLNLDEAQAFLAARDAAPIACDAAIGRRERALDAAIRLAALGATTVIVTLGSDGAAYASDGLSGLIAPVPAQPIDITGAGDAMIAATLAGLMAGDDPPAAIRMGMLLGALTTETASTVHPSLSPDFLDANRIRLDKQEGID